MLEASFQLKQGHEVLNVQASIEMVLNEKHLGMFKTLEVLRAAIADAVNQALQTVENADRPAGSSRATFPPNDVVNLQVRPGNRITFDIRGGNPDIEEALKRSVEVKETQGYGRLVALGEI
eukprot:SAG31_NODE_32104_length_360_cov_0.597701_1_plen_120_part_11